MRARSEPFWRRRAKRPPSCRLPGKCCPPDSVGIETWIDRLNATYLQSLCRKSAHFKLVLAPYGGGKTHFMMSLGSKALEENFAVAYIACLPGVDLTNSLELYRAFAKAIQVPGEDKPGLKRFLQRVIRNKLQLIQSAGAPDADIAFARWLENVAGNEHQESAFGRVMAEALRAEYEPAEATVGDAPLRWLRGEIDTLTKEELAVLRLAKYPAKAKNELGRNLIISMTKFAWEAGLEGVVVLFDEAETMFNATGKALLRILSAMRVIVDLPSSVPGGVPLFGVFSAVPEVLEAMTKYPALEQRMAVRGVSFEEGSDYAIQLHLEKVQSQEAMLRAIGLRLLSLGRLVTGHEFDRATQEANVSLLARVAASRNLQIDARRLFVKACVNILDAQTKMPEKRYSEDELSDRYQGFFEMLEKSENRKAEP